MVRAAGLWNTSKWAQSVSNWNIWRREKEEILKNIRKAENFPSLIENCRERDSKTQQTSCRKTVKKNTPWNIQRHKILKVH